jgi:MSHA biogenesis protein MshO
MKNYISKQSNNKRIGIICSKIHKSKGFTLIEMVVVIVILGVLSTSFIGFIKLGTQIYMDVTDRDELVSSARFSVERLNRELRMALPNSIRNLDDAGSKYCIEFYPITANVVYSDIPVSPEDARNTATIIHKSATTSPISTYAVVYPLSADELYDGFTSNRIHAVESVVDQTGNEWLVTFDADEITFANDSPTGRLFFVTSPVSYCVVKQANESWHLLRYQNYPIEPNDLPDEDDGVLMAEHLAVSISPFDIENASLLRNASILVTLSFTRNDETITFNNEVQVRNVP